MVVMERSVEEQYFNNIQLIFFLLLLFNKNIMPTYSTYIEEKYCIFTTEIMHIMTFIRLSLCMSSAPHYCAIILIYLIRCGQLLAVGSERDNASGQVDQTADLQFRVAAVGGRRADCIRSTHHVAVTPLDTAATKAENELDMHDSM